MHFTGRTWRPPYESQSVILQATSGCTHNKCAFCNLYKDEKFRMSPMDVFEKDLAEVKSYQPNARRIFLTGANPFAMSYDIQTTTTINRTTLYIQVSHKTADEMADYFHFNADQRKQLAELLAEGNRSMWSAVLYGIGTGDGEIVTVALSQLGNVGGQPYWSWYGFGSRVECVRPTLACGQVAEFADIRSAKSCKLVVF